MKRSKTDGTRKGRPLESRGGRRARNPLRHGCFFQGAVLPGVESVRDFRRFQSKITESVAPRNELQRWLTRRIASLAWRLNRVEAYETAVIEQGQQKAAAEAGEAVEDQGHRLLEYVLKHGPAHLELLKSLANPTAEVTVKGREALEVVGVVAHVAGVRLEDVPDLPAEDLADPSRHPLLKNWTRPEILEVIAAIARRAGCDPESLRQKAVHTIESALAGGEAQENAMFTALDHRRRLHLLPDPQELDRILRYEAHGWRLLQRALHELEALQARDRGEQVPLARLDVDHVT